MKFNWQKIILPHLLAIGIFIVLGFVYCTPALQGEVVNQYDMVQVQGMSKEARDFYEKTQEHPLWTNSMFGGMPSYIIYTGPSANKLTFLNSLFALFLPQPVNMLFLAMLGMYLLLCVLGFRYWIRVLGAVAFGFSSFNLIIISAGHVTQMMTMAYMAPVLAGILLTYRGRYLIGGALTAIAAAMLIYNNHIQIMYYTLVMIGLAVIGELICRIRSKQLPRFFQASGVLVIAGILAVLPASDNLLITKEYAPYSIRGSRSELTLQNKTDKNFSKGGLNIDYAYQWSMGKLETFSILIPNIYGGPASPDFISSSKTYNQLVGMGAPPQQADAYVSQFLYWGPQPSTSPVYFGVIICFLFVLSLFLVRHRYKWWLLAATVVAILMSWGKNFAPLNDFLFYHLPLYNKFRAPSMSMVIPQLCFVVLACWALQEVFTDGFSKKDGWEAVKKSLYITGGLILLLTFFTGSFLGYTSPNDESSQMATSLLGSLRDDRASLLHSDGIRSLILMLIAAGALWAWLKNKLKTGPVVAILGLALLFDLFQVDKRYLNNDSFVDADQYAAINQPTQADQLILQDKDPDYRVLNLTANVFNDARTSYFHKSIGGYSPAKLWRYQDLIDFQIQPEIGRIVSRLQGVKQLDSASLEVFQSSPVLNMLNTKYFIINPNGPPVENRSALGNAWFVQYISWVPDANSEMTTLTHFDPRNIAVIDQRFKKEIGTFQPAAKDTGAAIQLAQYGLNEMKYRSSNSMEGFGVFSDIYYPAGWKAYIDGKETPIVRVDYALRGLMIPAGKHEIDFKFHPDTFFLGQKISGISSIILILLVIGALVMEGWRKKNTEDRRQKTEDRIQNTEDRIQKIGGK